MIYLQLQIDFIINFPLHVSYEETQNVQFYEKNCLFYK